MQYLKKDIYNKILQSAVAEFRECGFADASIRNIATNAEVSVGNVYRYFTDKESLYLAVINPFIEDVRTVIETGLIVSGKSTVETARDLVKFLMEHRDHLIIIRKGENAYYEKFVGYILDVTSAKFKQLFYSQVENAAQLITNDKFFDVIAQSFVYALFKILRNEDAKKVQERKCRELITYFFGNLKNRYYHFDLSEDAD